MTTDLLITEYRAFLPTAFGEIAKHGPDANSEWARRDMEFGRMLQDAGVSWEDISTVVAEESARFSSLSGKGVNS